VKVGTCSALDDRLREGGVIVPCGALIDEGATYWRQMKVQHDIGIFNTQRSVDNYIRDRQIVWPHDYLRKKLIEHCKQNAQIPYQQDITNPCVWSVDAYDCFDGSPRLYSQVNRRQYILGKLLSEDVIPVNLVGVEMECSALFASAQALNIPAAALIVISRTRERLISNNTEPEQRQRYNIPVDNPPKRDDNLIQQSEHNCIRVALDVLENWEPCN
jgi:uridine phosphorylase